MSHTLIAPNAAPARNPWTEVCGNPECRSGWLQLWRRRACPRFEGKWACSAQCMEQNIAARIRSQIESWDQAPAERALRMPLGLILLSRGWISREELQSALAAQRDAQQGRIGEWLCRLHGIPEATIAKALAIQWNCAVLLSQTPGLESAASDLPPFFKRHYQLALMRQGAQPALYLAGRCRAEHAASRAVEHILGMSARAAFLEDHEWSRQPAGAADPDELTLPGPDGAAAHISALMERSRPYDARLVRIHDHLWLRMWRSRQGRRRVDLRDVILPLRACEYQDGLLRAG